MQSRLSNLVFGAMGLGGGGRERAEENPYCHSSVCVHRGWKASYIFGLCGSYYFVTKDKIITFCLAVYINF